MCFSEWYGYHFPELIKIVSDNATYCKLAKFIGNRKELSEESLEALEELTMDSAKAQAILDASRSSMGEFRVSYHLGISFGSHDVFYNLSIHWIHVMTAYHFTEQLSRFWKSLGNWKMA